MLLLAASDSGKYFSFQLLNIEKARERMMGNECGVCHSAASATETSVSKFASNQGKVPSESNWPVACPWSAQEDLVKIL